MASGKGIIPWSPWTSVSASQTGLGVTPTQVWFPEVAGGVGGWSITNASVGFRYVKLYDSVAAPVIGTDTPRLVLGIPPGLGQICAPGYAEIDFIHGCWAICTVNPAYNDTTAPGSADVVVNLWVANSSLHFQPQSGRVMLDFSNSDNLVNLPSLLGI